MVKPDRSRYIWLYARSKAQKQRFQSLADSEGTSLSKFLLNLIEERTSEESRPISAEISEELDALREENTKLKEEIHVKSLRIDQQETELRKLQDAMWSDRQFVGSRHVDLKIIEALRRGPLHDYKLVQVLGIDPTDSDAINYISMQLVALESYGIVAKTTLGWKWKA